MDKLYIDSKEMSSIRKHAIDLFGTIDKFEYGFLDKIEHGYLSGEPDNQQKCNRDQNKVKGFSKSFPGIFKFNKQSVPNLGSFLFNAFIKMPLSLIAELIETIPIIGNLAYAFRKSIESRKLTWGSVEKHKDIFNLLQSPRQRIQKILLFPLKVAAWLIIGPLRPFFWEPAKALIRGIKKARSMAGKKSGDVTTSRNQRQHQLSGRFQSSSTPLLQGREALCDLILLGQMIEKLPEQFEVAEKSEDVDKDARLENLKKNCQTIYSQLCVYAKPPSNDLDQGTATMRKQQLKNFMIDKNIELPQGPIRSYSLTPGLPHQ